MKPFLKWAGGKRWLVEGDQIAFPTFSGRYIEPFLGGGAVFFHLKPREALLSDLNEQLVTTYQAIKSDWQSVWRLLETYQKSHSKEFYYEERSRQYDNAIAKAAQFLYLNRTCYNGLYRENLKGKFNVPKGTKDRVLLPDDNFAAASLALANAKLTVADFSEAIAQAQKDDFVFVDPPYTITHSNGSFLKYNQRIFTWADQERLKESVAGALKRGAKVIVTNANHESILDLYSDLGTPKVLYRSSVMAGSREFRGQYSELVYVL